jgi:hypothetical protein
LTDRTVALERELSNSSAAVEHEQEKNFESVRRDIERLRKAQQQQVADALMRASQQTELGKLVHTLMCDAETRCSLDDEMTGMLEHFSKDTSIAGTIYGPHGWRNTTGSVTDRSHGPKGVPMPPGMSHKAGGGLPKDALHQRRKILSDMRNLQMALPELVR